MKKNCLATILLALILTVNMTCFATGKQSTSTSAAPTTTEDKFPEPNAASAFVIDTKSGNIIYNLNADKKVYPAGLTNIMTALLVLENKNLTDTCQVTQEALANTNQSYLTLKVGEVYTVEQLLHAIILDTNSAASNTLAIAVSGSTTEFVKLMNQKAKEMGLNGTNFTNPSGLHDENHYTTASDMAYLAMNARQNQTFASIAKTPTYVFPPTSMRSTEVTLLSNNHLVSRYKYPYHFYTNATGLKAANSTEAGYCLVATAEKDSLSVLSVIMGAPNADAKDKAYSFKDTAAIFDHVFDNYKCVLIEKKGNVIESSKVTEAKNSTRLALTLENDLYVTLKKSADTEIIEHTVNITEKAKAPIEQGQVFGTVTYTYGDRELATVNLVAANEVKRDFILHIINSVLGFIFHPIVIIVVVVAVYIWVRLRIARNRKRRLRRSKMVSMQRARSSQGSASSNSRLSRGTASTSTSRRNSSSSSTSRTTTSYSRRRK